MAAQAIAVILNVDFFAHFASKLSSHSPLASDFRILRTIPARHSLPRFSEWKGLRASTPVLALAIWLIEELEMQLSGAA
jgi:hypothetical protein